jgi:hypothetical protein
MNSSHSFVKALIVVLVVAFASGYALKVLRRMGGSYRRTTSASQLNSIGKALWMYADANNNTFPERMWDLYPKYISDYKVSYKPGEAPETAPKAPLLEGSYVYNAGLKPQNAVSVIAYEKIATDGGRNVLVVGGSVEFMQDVNLKTWLEQYGPDFKVTNEMSK